MKMIAMSLHESEERPDRRADPRLHPRNAGGSARPRRRLAPGMAASADSGGSAGPRLEPPRAMTGRGAGRRRSRNVPGNGSPDSDMVFKIKQYLRKEHRIPFLLILTECSIRFYPDGYDILGTLELWQIRGLVHTPDITVIDGAGGLLFIIEQDGRIHESADLAARDKRRNGHYAKAGIPYIVLRSSEIRSSGLCMARRLDEELGKIGMKKPAGLHLRLLPGPVRPHRTGGRR